MGVTPHYGQDVRIDILEILNKTQGMGVTPHYGQDVRIDILEILTKTQLGYGCYSPLRSRCYNRYT